MYIFNTMFNGQCNKKKYTNLTLRDFVNRATPVYYYMYLFRNACTKSGSLRFSVFRLLTDFVCLYTYEFLLSLCKIARSSVILLLPLFDDYFVIEQTPTDVLCVIDGHSSKPRWSKSIILRSERCYSTNYNTGSCRDNSVITLF
jgi:hypothetical protein